MTARPSPRRFPRAGVIVAESFVGWLDPALARYRDLPVASTQAVLGAVMSALAPAQADDPPPTWLRPSQLTAYRRCLAAVRSHGGALLAEPPGAGKTWIALAVALRAEGAAACVVPAALRRTWTSAAAAAGVPVTVTTHEAWSRGPRVLGAGLIIIDEAHGFRSPGINRTANLAPALVGRRGLLLTATPIVNRAEDLIHQLLLLVRDDTLATAGVPSLRAAAAGGPVPQALGEIVVAGTAAGLERPVVRTVTSRPSPAERRQVLGLMAALDRLALSPDGAVESLVRGVLLTTLASSTEALRRALTRYRALVLQALDAGLSGQAPGRHAIRRALGGDLDQVVMWTLLPVTDESDLIADDLPILDELLAALPSPGQDPKADRLARLLADGRPSLVFTMSRATVHHLRRRLVPSSRVGWCTGSEAGIGPARLRRAAVLGWFRPGVRDHCGLAPHILVTTDVAAEGLDLQRAARVVHYDLPWTPGRLEQRAGRARRPGGEHRTVEVVRFEPPAPLGRRLGVFAALVRKAGIPGRFGLGERADPAWTWRTRLAASIGPGGRSPAVAAAASRRFRLLAGFRLGSAGRVHPGVVMVLTARGEWRDDPATLEAALEEAAADGNGSAPTRPEIIAALRRIRHPIDAVARRNATSVEALRPRIAELTRAIARVHAVGRDAARRRDRKTLALADRGLAFLRRGHTTGERRLAETLGTAGPERLSALLADLPVTDPVPCPPGVTLTGLVIFRPR